MTNNEGSKEKLSPEEMLNSTEEMLHEEHDSLPILIWDELRGPRTPFQNLRHKIYGP